MKIFIFVHAHKHKPHAWVKKGLQCGVQSQDFYTYSF